MAKKYNKVDLTSGNCRAEKVTIVLNYVNSKIFIKATSMETTRKIKAIEKNDCLSEDEKSMAIAIEKYRLAAIKASHKYVRTETDKKTFNLLKGECNETCLKAAFKSWFKGNFSIQFEDNAFANIVLFRAGHKVSYELFTKTNGSNIVQLDANQVINMLYLTTYEMMVEKSIIRPADIPDVFREKWLKDKKKSK